MWLTCWLCSPACEVVWEEGEHGCVFISLSHSQTPTCPFLPGTYPYGGRDPVYQSRAYSSSACLHKSSVILARPGNAQGVLLSKATSSNQSQHCWGCFRLTHKPSLSEIRPDSDYISIYMYICNSHWFFFPTFPLLQLVPFYCDETRCVTCYAKTCVKVRKSGSFRQNLFH